MPLMVLCPGCKRKLRIPDTLLGKTVQCPQCARKLKIAARQKPAEKEAVGAPAPVPGRGSAAGTLQKKAPPAKPKAPAPAAKKAPPPNHAAPSLNKTGVKPKAAAAPRPAPAAPPTAVQKTTTAQKPAAKAAAPAARPKPVLPPRPAKKSSSGGFLVYVLGAAGLVAVLGAVWFFFLSGPARGQVRGVVTFDGKALEGAVVTFMNEQDSFEGTTDDAGNYTMLDGNSDIPAGTYKVTISKKIVRVVGEDGEEEERQLLPEIYTTEGQTPLSAEVARGANKSFDFSLQRKAPP